MVLIPDCVIEHVLVNWYVTKVAGRASRFYQCKLCRILPYADKAVFAKSDHPEVKGWSYRDMWWHIGNTHNGFTVRGVHG